MYDKAFEEGDKTGGGRANYEKVLKKYIHNPDVMGTPDKADYAELLAIVNKNISAKGYDKLDVVSGATYTGRGLWMPFSMLLQKPRMMWI